MEHVHACYTKALRTGIRVIGPRLGILPHIASARVEENGDEEEVDEAFTYFFIIRRCYRGLPLRNQGLDARDSSIQMPPTPMRGDLKDRVGSPC